MKGHERSQSDSMNTFSLNKDQLKKLPTSEKEVQIFMKALQPPENDEPLQKTAKKSGNMEEWLNKTLKNCRAFLEKKKSYRSYAVKRC